MCFNYKVLEQSTCDETLSLEEKIEIARRRSKESKSSGTTEHDDFVKELTK